MPKNARKDIKKGLGKGLGALLQTSEQTFEEINQQQTHELPLKEIEPNPDQPRKNFTEDALETLMESIKNFGIVQPIVVRKKGKKYQIVNGDIGLQVLLAWTRCQLLSKIILLKK